jgi:hypothetical protein
MADRSVFCTIFAGNIRILNKTVIKLFSGRLGQSRLPKIQSSGLAMGMNFGIFQKKGGGE